MSDTSSSDRSFTVHLRDLSDGFETKLEIPAPTPAEAKTKARQLAGPEWEVTRITIQAQFLRPGDKVSPIREEE